MFRIENPESKYLIKPMNLIMANENKASVFLSRRVRLKVNDAAIVNIRMKNYDELSDNKQVCRVPNPNSQKCCYFWKILLNNQEWPLHQCLAEYS